MWGNINNEGVAAEDREDQGAGAADLEDRATVAAMYDGGAQLVVAVVERTDLEEGVGGGREVAGDQRDHEAVEGGT